MRCERFGVHVDCGVVLSGKKFHRRVDLDGWNADVAALIAAAYAAAPAVDEIDLWATVPAGAGYGTVVSGDFAKPSSANVFSITVPRALRDGVRSRLRDGRGVFWDPAFRASVAKGSDG